MISLWDRALPLEGEPLKTVTRKTFKFAVVSEGTIKITTEGRGVHTISRIQFNRIDDNDLVFSGVTPQQLTTKAGVKKGQSYLAGIIEEVVRRGL